jgi:hypothetical protein
VEREERGLTAASLEHGAHARMELAAPAKREAFVRGDAKEVV